MDSSKVTDLLGHEVTFGDTVVIARTGYRDLTVATVLKITPKGIQAEFKDWKGRPEKTYRQSRMFLKVAA